jgi:hypothetical protein
MNGLIATKHAGVMEIQKGRLSLMDQPRYLYDNILLFILEKKNTDALTN